VALPEKEAAVAVLRMHEGYNDAELEVTGEAPAESIDWLDMKAQMDKKTVAAVPQIVAQIAKLV
jgi:hypothetical protein